MSETDKDSNDKVKSTYQQPSGMASLFGQVDEVKTVMMDNIKEIHARGEKLEQLNDTAEEMLGTAKELSGAAKKK